MAVPDFQSLMLPVLETTASGEISAADLRDKVASRLGLSSDDLAAKLPSGRQTTFANRTAWANVFLQRAGLIEKIGRGRYRASETGLKTLAEHPQKIDMAFLQRFPDYVQWRQKSAVPGGPTKAEGEALGPDELSTPEEQIATSYKTLNAAIEAELLDRVRGMSPAFFETLIIDLLIKLGYGGGQPEMGQAIGKSGDGGIDGVIKEDALGLDRVCLQAKRYGEGQVVGRPEVQAFAGSLDGVGATKGILITTGSFSSGARDYVLHIPKRIILIDGVQLTRLMVEREVGVLVFEVFKVKKIDENYFTEG